MSEIKQANKALVMENKLVKAKNAELQCSLNELIKRIESLEQGKSRKQETTGIVTTENRFSALESEEEDDSATEMEYEPVQYKKRVSKKEIFSVPFKEKSATKPVMQVPQKRTDVASTSQTVAAEAEKEKEVTAKAPKMSGRIKVRDLKAKVLLEKLENVKVNLKPVNNRETLILCTPEDRLEICDKLRETDHRGHSYKTQEDNIERRLLKNINKDFSGEQVFGELKEKLDEMGTEYGGFSIERFETYHSITSGKTLPIWVVKAENKETINLLTSITRLCYSTVEWEKMRKAEITQCFNCFRFGHSRAGQCFRDPVCKRCGVVGDHACAVQLREQYDKDGKWQNIYADSICCNCSTEEKKIVKGHPPTWSGCPYYKKQLGKVREARQEKLKAKEEKYRKKQIVYIDANTPSTSAWVNKGRQAEAQRKAPQRKQVVYEEETQEDDNQQSSGFNMEDEIKRVLQMSTNEVGRIADNFIEKYKKLTTLQQKQDALGMYFLEIKKWRP